MLISTLSAIGVTPETKANEFIAILDDLGKKIVARPTRKPMPVCSLSPSFSFNEFDTDPAPF